MGIAEYTNRPKAAQLFELCVEQLASRDGK
jgi:hypothetical protein